ncbi:MAG: replicative DNA helicase, partial [Patescibacteria group bacterium]|nr:replicative DNA helicase [Patescibacteria group bacterium]
MADNQTLVRLPPQSPEAEISVLGSLMLDKDAIVKVADVISPEDFYDNRHRLIYEAMQSLFTKSIPIDILTLTNALEEKKSLDKVGGGSYLTELINSVPSAANVVHYAFIVRKKGTLRRLISTASEINNLAYDDDAEIDQILDKAESQIFGVSQQHLKQNFVSINNILSAAKIT